MDNQKDLISDLHGEGPQATSSDALTGLRSRVSATITTTPIRDPCVELGKARSETGTMIPTRIRKTNLSRRELQNLASTNNPGIGESSIPPTTRKTRSSYTQLKQEYEFSLQRVLNDNADMPL